MHLKKFLFHSPHLSYSFTFKTSLLGLSASLIIGCGQSKDKTASTSASQTCSKISIASMNWQSAEALAQIDKIILEKGYGCEVEIVPGDTVSTTTSMTEKGKPDIAPELWLSSVREPIEKAVNEGRLHIAGNSLQDGGIEGWWIPKYIADSHLNIRTIDDALDHPELFPSPDNKAKGVIYNCPSGWACQISTSQAFKAWGATKKGFVLKDPGSAAGLDGSIAKAYQRKEGWLGYYWAPSSILGKYQMVKLDTAIPFNEAEWNRCNIKKDCQNPQKNEWMKSEVVTVVTDNFKIKGGAAYNYIAKRSWNNDTVNTLLAWMSSHQATGEDGAKYFLKNNPEVWTAWVDEAVAIKIKGDLK